MNSDPLSKGLHATAERYEDSYSATGARPSVGLASRVLRRRITTIVATSALSLGLVAGSGIAVARILDSAPTDSTDPVAPPVPEGYERVVLPLDIGSMMTITFEPDNSAVTVLEIESLGCDAPFPSMEEGAGPFHLDITSVRSSFSGYGLTNGQGVESAGFITARLSYDGSSDGIVTVSRGFWSLLDSDQQIASTVSSHSGISFSEPTTNLRRLNAPFSMDIDGIVPLEGCVGIDGGGWDLSDSPEPVLLDPGSYSVIAMVKVEWSAIGAILLDANQLGYDASWFGEGWQDVVPCRDAIAEAKHAQNGNAIECVPHLYYQQIPNVGNYAIVDVPNGFLDGPRKTWYVVSDPYPIELPLDDEPPTA
jgi:hypothetical protein